MDTWMPYAAAFPGPRSSVSGDVRVRRAVAGHGLAPRDLLVWLPPGALTGKRGFPVLYMHDGQNCFDEATSYAGEWEADEAAGALAARGLEAIVVAVPHGGEARMDEYGPWPDTARGVGGRAGAFLGFLVETVKPLVDGSFPTLTSPAHTGLAGSSMGGLVSLWAALTRPDLFGFCGAFSPSLWFAGRRLLGEPLPAPGPRVYLDTGWLEDSDPPVPHPPAPDGNLLDARAMRDRLSGAGFTVAYLEDRAGGHDEASWRRRFPAVLEWFLDPQAQPGQPERAGHPGVAA